jgi:Beta-lactamase enzyme family
VALPIVIGLLTGPLFLARTMESEPVARLEVPMLSSGPEAPSAGSQSGSNPDLRTGSEAASDVTRVETELTEEKTEFLRSELGQIAQAYPATYGVVVLDPSSGERVAMDADRRFLAASLNKLPVLMTLYRAAASGVVDLDDKISPATRVSLHPAPPHRRCPSLPTASCPSPHRRTLPAARIVGDDMSSARPERALSRDDTWTDIFGKEREHQAEVLTG